MRSSFWDTILGHGKGKRPTMGGMLLRGANVFAWKHRHTVVRVEHVVSVLVDLVDVTRALEARGMHVADVEAVLDQLVEDLPRLDADAPETEPKFDPALDPITASAKVNASLSSARFIEGLAHALPVELGFLRGPLASSAPELGVTFDAPIGWGHEGGLTFEGWDDDLKTCLGLMQALSDAKWESWSLGPFQLFFALLAYKPYFAHFKGRGSDPTDVVRELGQRLATERTTWPARGRPPALTPTVGPALFALVLRAERYAAADASDVKLRHLLLALHDEPHLAPSIDRLVA